MSFKLIVFDWDGTLMDSEAKIVSCIQVAFEEIGEPPPSREAARDVIGLGLEDAMAKLWPGAEPEERARVVERYRYHFLSTNETPATLFPGASELLDWLIEREYLLAVATPPVAPTRPSPNPIRKCCCRSWTSWAWTGPAP